MSDPVVRLVFIEGLFGSGKSTTAELLERELGADGRQVVSWHEFAEGHPIPIHPGRVEQEVLDPDPIARVEAKWDVAKLRVGSGTLVLESRLFQHAAMYPLLADQPASAIKGLLSRLYTRLVPLQPRLVFFSHGDIAARVESVCAAPDRRNWLDLTSALATRLPWASHRGLQGEAGWRAFMLCWGELLEELAAECPFEKLVLRDARRDRPASVKEILSFLE